MATQVIQGQIAVSPRKKKDYWQKVRDFFRPITEYELISISFGSTGSIPSIEYEYRNRRTARQRGETNSDLIRPIG